METIILDESQEAAVNMICGDGTCRPKLAIKTGGPGTGKTTTLMSAISRLTAFDIEPYHIALAAPTGKAAKRITEQVQQVYPEKALTIHRLLGFNPAEGWVYCRDNPLPHKLVIVDEASMIDSLLLSRLIQALPEGSTLILVGDVNQLPPVGAGQPFRDLIAIKAAPTAILTTNHRQAQGSLIAHNADKILRGKMPEFGKPGGHSLGGVLEDDCFLHPEEEHEDVLNRIITLYRESPHKDSVVLIPQRTTKIGVEAVNRALQGVMTGGATDESAYLPGKENFINPGDPVLHIKNNYNLGVFNGEVGRYLGKSSKVYRVEFPDRTISYEKSNLSELYLAYAMTVHKSQGSEYDHVIFVAHTSHTYMLSRPLIYTALTRAKKRLDIVGEKTALQRGIRQNKITRRNTVLSGGRL